MTRSELHQTEFLVFRHGETDWNREQRLQGQLDIPLNANGRAQAQALVPVLQPERLDLILSSDLSRALETARIVGTALNIPIESDARLREAHLGGAQGLTRHEIETRFGVRPSSIPSALSDADAPFLHATREYPGGETADEVLQRAWRALEEFARRHPGAKAGVATHGGIIRRLMATLLPAGAPPVPIPNAVVYRIGLRGTVNGSLERLNLSRV